MDCLNPVGIKNPKTGESIRVRCMKRNCIPCNRFKASQWYIRLKEQMKESKNNWFLTLTIDDDHLTWSGSVECIPTLNRRDVQLFMKRLRKRLTEKVKFYAVGEYGSNTKRPHYHIILFNSGIDDIRTIQWIIQGAWTEGFSHVGSVTEASIRYVAGYMEKSETGNEPSEEVQRQFNQMSQGMGLAYLTPEKLRYHKQNQKFEYSNGGGQFTNLPRYYVNKIFTENEKAVKYEKWLSERVALKPSQEENKKFSIEQRIRAFNQLKNKRK